MLDQDLQGVGGWFGSEGDGGGCLREREAVGDERADIQLALEDQTGDFALEGEVGGITSREGLFVDADDPKVDRRSLATHGVGKEECGASAAECGLGLMDGGIGGDRDDGGIDTAFEGESAEFVDEIGTGGVEGLPGAPLAGELQTGGEEVGGNDADALEEKEAGEEESDRALTGDKDDVFWKEWELADALDDGVDGFEQGAFEERVGAWDLHHAGEAERQDADVFGVASAGGLESGRDAGALVGFALGKGAVSAEMAIHAGNVMVERHTVPDPETPRRSTHLDDRAAGLVTEDAGGGNSALLDLLDVGGAHTAGGDPDEDLARPDAGDVDRFQTKVVDAAVDNRLHGLRKHCGRVDGLGVVGKAQESVSRIASRNGLPDTRPVQRPIVILSPLLPPMRGGLADHTWLMAKHLSETRPVAVLSSRDVYTNAPFPIRASVHDWEDVAELDLEMVATPSDALLLWQYVPHMYGRGGVNRPLIALWKRLKREGRKQVMIAHEIAAPWGRWPNQWWYAWNHRRQWRAIMGLADLIPISTEAWTEQWLRSEPSIARKLLTLPSPSSIERVPVGPNHRAEWRQAQGLPPDAKVMLWWGSVSGPKQLMWVVDAWETACAQVGPVVLCIVGGNPSINLPGSLRSLTRIMGFLKPEEVSRCLQAADLVALPFSDGASERRTTLMAALGHGVAVASTAGHNTGSTLRKADFLSLSPADDALAFTESVLHLLRDNTARTEMARRGKEAHDAAYSWPVVTQKLLGAMDSVGLLSVVPLPSR